MGVNCVTTYVNQYEASTISKKEAKKEEKKELTSSSEKAVIYEKSGDTNTYSSSKTDRVSIEQLKKEAEQRTAAFKQLVQKVLLKQGKTATSFNDLIHAIKSEDFEVDEEIRAQAQEEISEDGYWGVKQTSERLFSFATALCGNDTSKADEMIAAVQKGYEQATKTWGEELPEICKDTYDAFVTKMNQWKNQSTES